jgi:hypothetical protein
MATKKTTREAIAEWTAAINELGFKSKTSHFVIGDTLKQCKEDLSKKDYETVVGGSFLKSLQHANNYIRLASKAELRDPEVLKDLPMGLKALLYLSSDQWTKEHLLEGIRAGKIHTHASRDEVKVWRDEQDSQPHDNDNDNGEGAGGEHGGEGDTTGKGEGSGDGGDNDNDPPGDKPKPKAKPAKPVLEIKLKADAEPLTAEEIDFIDLVLGHIARQRPDIQSKLSIAWGDAKRDSVAARHAAANDDAAVEEVA